MSADPADLIGPPPAGRHQVVVVAVTYDIHRQGRGYHFALRINDGRLWWPRMLWFQSDRVSPAIVARDLAVLSTLFRAVASPGTLTEREMADTMIGLTFIATTNAAGSILKAEIVWPEGGPAA